ncbi:hypothetical protein PPERSA_02828 [Pseudocohnilembus persalinus]|uniref:GRIP domain-containing protein n=1 Tax=Pseudocohnilembus persalinus TaxID=266149 RepID=A0A0V0QM58_PSEPJ|nr:hypothetical protein PPERSA_02828 [Pseudocohnilembus persalinus]|eukprot:KRX03449.1 hypothetical protein PPERSA_02828 [Pseudocohnilembus persalinus]
MSITQQESPKIIEQECDQDSYSQPLNLTITSQSSFEEFELIKQEQTQLSITLIDESESIRENCLQFMAEENQDEDKKAEETQEIRFLLQRLQKMNISNDLEPLINLKDHIIILQQTIFDILKKQKINNEDQQTQQKKLSEIIMKMKAQIAKEGKEKQEILVQGRNKIKELEKQFEKYKSESILQFKEKDVKIEFLNKEMKKNIDTQYLKNILVKFFLAEKKVKQRLLPCIGTVLQFSDEELKQIQEQIFPKEQMTFLNSIFTFGGNN